MSQTKLPKWAIIGLAALVLLGIGSAVHSAGWSQGYMMGLLTGSADSAEIMPYLVSRTHGWHGGPGAPWQQQPQQPAQPGGESSEEPKTQPTSWTSV